MTHVDLFSGIGGFALAAKWCWGDEYVPLAHSDVEEFACKVYHNHFPESECLGDITKIDWGRFAGRVDLLTGGFPCQPFSLAGKRGGKTDDRWLWPEMLRAIREIRPRWVVGENVAGLINMGLDEVLSDLEGEGYTTEAFVIPACATNAPHRRDRVWIVAYSEGVRGGGRSKEIRRSHGGQNGKLHVESEYADSDAPDTTIIGLQRGILPDRGEGKKPDDEQLDGRYRKWDESWYEVALRTCVRRVGDGLPRQLDRSARLKALGNAIVPQVVYEIFKAIREIDG